MDKVELKAWIKSYEGFDAKPYVDSVGKLTIGFGRNLEDNGISALEADYLFNNDLERTIEELKEYPWYMSSPESCQNGLINMCFNLGITKLLTFKKMISSLNDKDYKKAAIEALNSKWAYQVGKRAKDIALMISGEEDNAIKS